MLWLLAACGSSLLVCAVVLGTFVPLQSSDGVEYLFAGPRVSTLLSVWLICVAALSAAYAIVLARARARSLQHATAARSGRWLSPICLLSGLVFGILPAAPGIGERGAVAGYFLYDLRWWWLGLAVVAALWRADSLSGAPLTRAADRFGRLAPGSRGLLLEAALFAGLLGWAVLTLPATRFENSLHGDEPKYVRYCELWYQGGGLDVSNIAPISDQNVHERPLLLRNIGRLLGAVPEEGRALARDLRNFVRDPAHFRWNRVRADSGFVTGKHGGVYQLHQPGVSLVLLPGYLVDRYRLSGGTTGDGKWPARLPMTNLMMLLIYGACGVAMFRLLRHALASDRLAWIWSAMALAVMPTSSFAFQLYPELPVLLLVLLLTNYLVFCDRTRLAPAVWAGAATGSLVWFHPRFLLISLCLTVAAMVRARRRARWTFLAACVALVSTELAFDYHVTGSWSPTARWEANDQGVDFSSLGFVLNFIGYGFDRTWGLLPHALLFAAVLPGLVVLSRQSLKRAVFVAALAVALVAPAAGHTLSAAGTTPGRLIVAIVPLLIWPVAVLVRRFWASSLVQSLTVVVGVLSLDAALSYNWNHYKPVGSLHAQSLSGWKLNLAFPVIRGESWESSSANFVLFLSLAAGIVASALVTFWRLSRPAAPTPPLADSVDIGAPVGGRSRIATVAALIVVSIGLFSLATTANGDWTSPRYLLNDEAARERGARALMQLDRCRVCFSSRHPQMDWTQLEPNTARGARVWSETSQHVVAMHVAIDGTDGQLAFGRVRIDFGDGRSEPWTGVVRDATFVHEYGAAGAYDVRVSVQLPAGAPRLLIEHVEVK